MAKKTKKGFDMDAVMNEAATATKGSKSKSKIPVIDVPELKQSIKEWLEANREAKTQESIMTKAFGLIRPVAEALRVRSCRDSKEFLNSVKLRSKEGEPTITFTQTASFTGIGQESKAVLQKTCEENDIDYDRYFESVPQISLKKDLTPEQREKVIKKMITTFKEQMREYFDVKYPITVKPQLLKDLAFDDGVERLFERLGPGSAASVITPKKPSLKA